LLLLQGRWSMVKVAPDGLGVPVPFL